MPVGIGSYERSVLPDSHWKALYEASALLMDHLFDDLQAFEDEERPQLFISDYLPVRHSTRYDEGFVRRFIMCAASVGLKMRLPGWHPLGCTGEELALHVIKELALTLLEQDGVGGLTSRISVSGTTRRSRMSTTNSCTTKVLMESRNRTRR